MCKIFIIIFDLQATFPGSLFYLTYVKQKGCSISLFYTMRNICIIAGLAIIACCTSCSRYYYKPNGVNTPILSDKGQAELAGSVELGDESRCSNVQAGWSPANHIGIIADFSHFVHRENSPVPSAGNVAATAGLGEIGLGYYYASGDAKRSLVLDVYAGPGLGYLNSDVNVRFTRLFIQPGIALRTRYLELALNIRFSDMFYYNLSSNGLGDPYLIQQNLVVPGGRGITDGGYLFCEPAFTIRGGYKLVKLQLQWVNAQAMSHTAWNYETGQINFGIIFRLEEWRQLFHKGKYIGSPDQRD